MRNIQIQTEEVTEDKLEGAGFEEEGVMGRITLGFKEKEVR